MNGTGGKGYLGITRHGKSGHSGKSPALRHWLKREAEKQEWKRKRTTDMKNSVAELFGRKDIKK